MRRSLLSLFSAWLVAVPGCSASSTPVIYDVGVDAQRVDAASDGGDRRDASDPCADPDQDGDGADSMACGGVDCDDADALRAPGHPEICDVADRDEDCDARTAGFRDGDGDAQGDILCCNEDAAGVRRCGTDCDDARPDVHPGLPEACDGADNDCDGAVDEAVLRMFYADLDGDDFGDPASTPRAACTPMANEAENATDCDDDEAGVNPGASEACDRLDNDCDMSVDERLVMSTCYRDADLDGFTGSETMLGCGGCAGPEWLGAPTARFDCDDTNAMAFPGQTAFFDTPRTDGSWDYDCDGGAQFDPVPGVCASRPANGLGCTDTPAFRWTPAGCGESMETWNCESNLIGCINSTPTGSSSVARCR